jgi:hypothetical protein
MPSPHDINTAVLQLENSLREEAKEHREFLKDSIDQLKVVVGIIAVLGGAVFTWLNIKSGKDIRAQVNATFKAKTEALVVERLAEFEEFMAKTTKELQGFAEKVKKESEEFAEETKKRIEANETHINQLSSSFQALADTLTFAFAALDPGRTGPEWDAARRDVIRQLESLRVSFPVDRRVGILLGRLHRFFGEYEDAVNVLTAVLEERDKRKMIRDFDYAALLFNRACYENLIADLAKERCEFASAEERRSDAWNDLNDCVRLDPANKAQASKDPDLETLWNAQNRSPDALGTNSERNLRKSSKRTYRWTSLFGLLYKPKPN